MEELRLMPEGHPWRWEAARAVRQKRLFERRRKEELVLRNLAIAQHKKAEQEARRKGKRLPSPLQSPERSPGAEGREEGARSSFLKKGEGSRSPPQSPPRQEDAGLEPRQSGRVGRTTRADSQGQAKRKGRANNE